MASDTVDGSFEIIRSLTGKEKETTTKSEEVTTVKVQQKQLFGSSFLWPLMLLANNIGEILGVINVSGPVAYWLGLVMFIAVGGIGIIVMFLIRLLRKPKTASGDSERQMRTSRRGKLKKYTFWRHSLKDVFAFLSGALYVAGDNLTLFLSQEIYLDPDQLIPLSYLRSYLIAGSLLMIGMAHGFMLVMDPLCGLQADQKLVEKYKKKIKLRTEGLFSVESTDGPRRDDPKSDKPKEDIESTIVDGSGDATVDIHKESHLEKENSNDEEDDDPLPDLAHWQIFIQRLSLFLAVAALSDQFFGAIVDEIVQRDMNFTSGVACVSANRTAGIVFYSILSVSAMLGVVVTGIVYLAKWRKHIKIRTCMDRSCCGVFEFSICLILAVITLLYIPVYLTSDNHWPLICFANEYGTVDTYRAVRQFLLWVTFFMTLALLFMEPLLVSWPRRLLSYKEDVDENTEWHAGIRLRYLRKALPDIVKAVKSLCSKRNDSVTEKPKDEVELKPVNDNERENVVATSEPETA